MPCLLAQLLPMLDVSNKKICLLLPLASALNAPTLMLFLRRCSKMALNDKMAFTDLALPDGVSLYKVGR